MIVGNGEGAQGAFALEHEPETTGLVELADWPGAVTRLGIGIAPLADTKFNRGKSALKVLELSACGVPWVASPRAEYTRFHRQGCGVLADKPSRWYRHLRDLAGNPAMRDEMSAAGRDVAARWTIEGNAWKWAAAWEDALKVQRQAAVAVG